MKTITKSVINLSDIPESLHNCANLKEYHLHSYAEFHIDDSEQDELTIWLIKNFPTIKRKISFLIYIDSKSE